MDLEICCVCVLFVFFKQKTAYEMRISDWSSDVCSSDLCGRGTPARVPPRCCGCWLRTSCRASFSPFSLDRSFLLRLPCYGCQGPPNTGRSEEHTSELQSLMRISYAVFCLKKKKHTKQRHAYTTIITNTKTNTTHKSHTQHAY